jgi:DeoR family transcriptional regulator, fructose operon transcriptional repressor
LLGADVKPVKGATSLEGQDVLTQERHSEILRLLHRKERGAITVTELAAELEVSQMTIRRDLNHLHAVGLLRRVYGGATTAYPPADEMPFIQRDRWFGDEKEAIGRIAASLISPGEQIILDAGTTTLQIARNLAGLSDLVVVTSALPIAIELARCQNVHTIVLGGTLKCREQCTVGSMVGQALSRVSVDRAFLSAAAFNLERGATDPDMAEVEVKQAMMRSARQVILVADHNKWNRVTFAQIAPLQAFDALVTDDELSAPAIREIEAIGVEVITPRRRATTHEPEKPTLWLDRS